MNNSYQYQEGVTRFITATNPQDPYRDFTYQQSKRYTSHLLMGNLELNFEKGKLFYNSMYVHTGSAYAADFYGKESEIFQGAQDYNYEGLIRRLQINDNTVFVNQLKWDGKLSDRLKYMLGAGINYINGEEPDRRILMFQSVGNNQVQLLGGEGRNQRFNSQITETAILPKVNLQYNLLPESDRLSYVEVGYDGRISTKDFSAPIYNLIWAGGQTNSPTFDRDNIALDPYFNQENLSDGDFSLEHFNDTYDVKRNNHGAYVDVVHQLNSKLTLNAGVRADNVFTKINYRVNRGVSIGSNDIEGFFISPSINAKFELNRKNHLRFGASRTFTLPQDKEISPSYIWALMVMTMVTPILKYLPTTTSTLNGIGTFQVVKSLP
ncbi:TonB-dependent receptor domain-containing protein [Niabella ginsengisoli]|uniref:TonB-dependent receptor n=1 Tax=Niabella ginsengisoli TaxID=522298 RepID=A0ABS9SPR8_9BACT|nr:TonB-dependent receptor [Niabella ginsengisoli]MCH5600246.1 TonB-dependent receptor [Niabella ginsengisoli]